MKSVSDREQKLKDAREAARNTLDRLLKEDKKDFSCSVIKIR